MELIARDAPRPAGERLERWFDTLRLAKRHKILDDPELFRVYQGIVEKAHEVVSAQVEALLNQVERILADGAETGEFPTNLDTKRMAASFLRGTVLFHHPAMVVQEPAPTDADARNLFHLLLAGLRASL